MTKDQTTDIKRIELCGGIFGVVFGTLLHFSYAWIGQPWAGVFSAVNESPWEHLKLFVIPIVFYLFCVEVFTVKDRSRLYYAKLIQLLLGMLFIIAFYYTYTGAFGTGNLLLDISSFFFAVAASYYVSFRIITSQRTAKLQKLVSLVAVLTILLVVILTTYYPPHLPLFQDENSHSYGVGK